MVVLLEGDGLLGPDEEVVDADSVSQLPGVVGNGRRDRFVVGGDREPNPSVHVEVEVGAHLLCTSGHVPREAPSAERPGERLVNVDRPAVDGNASDSIGDSLDYRDERLCDLVFGPADGDGHGQFRGWPPVDGLGDCRRVVADGRTERVHLGDDYALAGGVAVGAFDRFGVASFFEEVTTCLDGGSDRLVGRLDDDRCDGPPTFATHLLARGRNGPLDLAERVDL